MEGNIGKAILQDNLLHHLTLWKGLHCFGQIGVGTVVARDEAPNDRHHQLRVDAK